MSTSYPTLDQLESARGLLDFHCTDHEAPTRSTAGEPCWFCFKTWPCAAAVWGQAIVASFFADRRMLLDNRPRTDPRMARQVRAARNPAP